MVVPLAKRRKVFNGYKLGDHVRILEIREVVGGGEDKEIRILGEAGFYVKGLATCFYWTEKGRTWDDVEKEPATREGEPCP
jgi:hypothetical protein